MAMAATTVSIAQKYGLPQFVENRDFDNWLRDLEIWEIVIDLPKISRDLLYTSVQV